MKRDWDTIRLILARLEEKEFDKKSITIDDFESLDDCNKIRNVSYNMELLFEAELVKGRMFDSSDSIANDFVAYRLTWAGHEFLDTISNESVWNITKRTFADKGVDMSFDTIKAVAAAAITSLLGL